MKGGKAIDVLAIGSAAKDIFILSKNLSLIRSNKFPSGYAECLGLGSKNDVDDLEYASGGGGTNSAAAFAKLGFSTAVCTNLGDDEFGHQIKKELKTLGIIDESAIKTKKKTAVSLILSQASSDRSILTFRGASAEMPINVFPLKKYAPKWFYVSSLHGNVAGMNAVLDRAEECGARVAWNPGGAEIAMGLSKLRPTLERLHLLILNREEAMSLLRTNSNAINSLLEQLSNTAEYVCITDGRNGAWLCTNTQAWHVKTTDVQIMNTTGAGDAFGSGLVAGFMKYGEPTQALQLAMLNAQSVIQHIGAKTGLLTKWPSEAAMNSIRVVDCE